MLSQILEVLQEVKGSVSSSQASVVGEEMEYGSGSDSVFHQQHLPQKHCVKL